MNPLPLTDVTMICVTPLKVVERGDYAALMGRVVAALKATIPHAANEHQTKMLERYVDSFDLGSIEEYGFRV
jgi:hypothetical protein